MSITQSMCTSFKKALLDGEMDFSSNTTQTFYIALYTEDAELNADTQVYTNTNEVVGTAYVAGGKLLTISQTPITSGTTAYINFGDVTWFSSTITARGALIYRNAPSNAAVAVLDFGSNKSTAGANFVIDFPTTGVNTALVRVL